MIVATEAVDEPDEHFTPEDLGDELDAPSVDPAVDSRAAVTPDGEIVAAGLSTARPMGGPMRRYDFWGAVHPAWRGQGLGRRLLAWQIERAAERHAQDAPDVPGWAGLGAEEKREDVWRLADRAGLTPLRWFTTLHRPLTTTAPLDPVDLASGLHLVPLGEDLDEAVRLAHNDAWTDHWGYAASPAADWNARVVGLRNLRRDWSHVVVDEAGDVVGYALNVSFEQDWEVQGFKEGYTLLLGVRRPWRGQGRGQGPADRGRSRLPRCGHGRRRPRRRQREPDRGPAALPGPRLRAGEPHGPPGHPLRPRHPRRLIPFWRLQCANLART